MQVAGPPSLEACIMKDVLSLSSTSIMRCEAGSGRRHVSSVPQPVYAAVAKLRPNTRNFHTHCFRCREWHKSLESHNITERQRLSVCFAPLQFFGC
mmetsp:Transcript_33495/g.67960  ORF Transcript_33495/g.67960 Transcript_33495/m.67960 type:complete len:96 (-) Transcript_33495:111-398(-)